MTTYALTIDDTPSAADQQALVRGLDEHAGPHTPRPGFKPLAAFIRNEDGTLVGGAYGYVNWNWLFINLVWLSPDPKITQAARAWSSLS